MAYQSSSERLPRQLPSVQQHFENIFQKWAAQLASTDCIQAVISDRRRRLFPERAPMLLTPLDAEAFWIDLPPELLLPGELNLVHEPSIFNSPLYVSDFDVMAQLVFSSHYEALTVHLRENGVSEQVSEAPDNVLRMGDAIYRCILAQVRRIGALVGQCCAFKTPRSYPRSIYTSPRRNAGVLFRTGWGDDVLNMLFADANEGKRYFSSQLCRLPVDPSRCHPRVEPIYESLSFRLPYSEAVPALKWEGLDTGHTHTWCIGTTLFVSPENNLALSDVEMFVNDSKWHAHCAPEDCCWLRNHEGKKMSTQALSVKAYHSALANHHGSKLPPPVTAYCPHRAPKVASWGCTPEKEYHQSLVEYCRRFVQDSAMY